MYCTAWKSTPTRMLGTSTALQRTGVLGMSLYRRLKVRHRSTVGPSFIIHSRVELTNS